MEVGRGGRGIKEVGQSNIYPSALIRRMGGTEGEGEREREKRESNENESRKVQFVVALICHCISPSASFTLLPPPLLFIVPPSASLSLSIYIYYFSSSSPSLFLPFRVRVASPLSAFHLYAFAYTNDTPTSLSPPFSPFVVFSTAATFLLASRVYIYI